MTGCGVKAWHLCLGSIWTQFDSAHPDLEFRVWAESVVGGTPALQAGGWSSSLHRSTKLFFARRWSSPVQDTALPARRRWFKSNTAFQIRSSNSAARVSVPQTESRRFESFLDHQDFCDVTQRAECRSVKAEAVGSSPTVTASSTAG